MYLEIRPGEGGDDAVQFAYELYEALSSHSTLKGHRFVTRQKSDRSIIAETETDFTPLTGTHRIQRIPRNDKRGRRHTSTVTVACLDHEPVGTIEINLDQIQVDYYRGSGKGGQHRNKTESAVRITHIPTGITACCEDQRKKEQNYKNALLTLTERVAALKSAETERKVNSARVSQIKSGERSVKQFTHNTQRNETKYHASGKTWRMDFWMSGKFDVA